MSIGTKVRNLVFVRKAEPEKEPVKEWLEANNGRNAFDPAVLEYPCTKVLAAHNNGTTYTYMPVQEVVVLDSVGFNPEATDTQIADSMIELVKVVAGMAHVGGIREIFFVVNDENVQKGAEYLGFKELEGKIMRLKI